MRETRSARRVAYGLAVLATGLSLLVRWPLWPVLGDRNPYMTFFPAVLVAAHLGGFGPGLLATALSALAATYFLVAPADSFEITTLPDAVAVALFLLTGVVISGLSESRHRSLRRIVADERRYAVTLASIGDAVIATDDRARITFLNPVAEALTGWPRADAVGRPLTEVFRVVNEQTRQPVEDPAARVLRLGTVVGLANHTALLARDGRAVPIDDCGAPIIDDRGAIAGVVLVFRDTSQRRCAEEAEALRRANARLELAVRGSHVGIWEIEMPDGDYRHGRGCHVNIWEQLGYDPPDSPTDHESGIAPIHPDDRACLEEAMRSYLAGEAGEFEIEDRVRHKDGSYRWMLTRGVAVRDAGGKPIRFAGIGVDITDRKRTEEALRASERRFRTFVDNATDAFFLFGEKLHILDVNRQASESLGYTRDELVGMTPLDLDPDLTPAMLEEHGRRLGEVIVIESRNRRKDGSVFPVEVRGQAFWEGDRQFTVAVARDITERKQTEEALRESERRFRTLTEALPHIVWTAEPDGALDYVNTRVTEYTGLTPEQTLG